jgi:hypothetical protein
MRENGADHAAQARQPRQDPPESLSNARPAIPRMDLSASFFFPPEAAMSTARKFLVPLLASAAVVALAGCWDPGMRTSRAEPNRGRGISAYVFDEDQLQHSPDGTLLSALSARMTAMDVLRGGECPVITLRGRTTVARPTNPGVYVDGARATNTCVLDMLNVGDVQRVEIYPMGIAQRGAYEGQAGGLILVFMRTGG